MRALLDTDRSRSSPSLRCGCRLDARTLAVLLRVPLGRFATGCTPNPFASRLPHLDQLFPGQSYHANAFLSVAVAPAAKEQQESCQ